MACKNFRAITILNTAIKMLPQIIFQCLSPKPNEFVGSYNTGFIDGRSTTDQIFTDKFTQRIIGFKAVMAQMEKNMPLVARDDYLMIFAIPERRER